MVVSYLCGYDQNPHQILVAHSDKTIRTPLEQTAALSPFTLFWFAVIDLVKVNLQHQDAYAKHTKLLALLSR